jgi:metal-responsive CopG/Arc/MetJ family transcriptional regulator
MPKTPHRQVRVDDDLWDRFGEAVERQGAPDRSVVLREFMAWYVREPGARSPQRPGLAA